MYSLFYKEERRDKAARTSAVSAANRLLLVGLMDGIILFLPFSPLMQLEHCDHNVILGVSLLNAIVVVVNSRRAVLRLCLFSCLLGCLFDAVLSLRLVFSCLFTFVFRYEGIRSRRSPLAITAAAEEEASKGCPFRTRTVRFGRFTSFRAGAWS